MSFLLHRSGPVGTDFEPTTSWKPAESVGQRLPIAGRRADARVTRNEGLLPRSLIGTGKLACERRRIAMGRFFLS